MRPTAVPSLFRVAILALVFVSAPAAAEKVLRYAFEVAESGFDPGQVKDLYSSTVMAHIFDAPYTLDYLARPYKVKPNTAVAMPEVSADGRTFGSSGRRHGPARSCHPMIR